MTIGGEGSTFGKYFLLKKIASGGMGEIFLAKLKGPVGFEKLLVVKRILSQHVENQEFVDMFFAEARIAAQLNHANIVQIYEMGEIDDAYFIAMEYVHGKSLRDIIDRAKTRGEYLHPAHVVEMITRLCSGMSYAHNAKDMSGQPLGIIHRDVNPHNVLLSYSGELKIIDFGIAKSEMSMNKTETGTIKGKFVYMSPEQSAAEKLDKRSDLFSVGICLYEALSFTNPFAKQNVVLSLDAIQRKDPPPVSEVNPKLKIFDPIVTKALAKRAGERYADCNDLGAALQLLVRNNIVDSPPQTLSELMQDLFEEQIEIEKRMILETDQIKTTQLESMRESQRREHSSGSRKIRVATNAAGRSPTEPDPANLRVEPPRSRMPFAILLSLIILATTAGAVTVVRVVRGQRLSMVSSATVVLTTPDVVKPPEPIGTLNPPQPDTTTTIEHVSEVDPIPQPHPGSKPTKPIPPKPTKPVGFGSMQMSSVPPVQITQGGSPVGQTFKLKGASGRLVFGNGTEQKGDPFKVTVNYRVNGSAITYTVDSEPWAIVSEKGGMGLGKTPLSGIKAEGSSATVLELANPKEGRQQRLVLKFSPP